MRTGTSGVVRAGLGAALACALLGAAWAGCYPRRVGPQGPDGERLTWPEMGLEQKRDHMARVVLPAAAEVFRAWRPERYPEVGCALCHGQAEGERGYAMPTDHLPRLSGEALLGPEFEQHPDTTRLKLDRLVPAMGEALGLATFSVVTRRGFGCYSCHLGPTGPMFEHAAKAPSP